MPLLWSSFFGQSAKRKGTFRSFVCLIHRFIHSFIERSKQQLLAHSCSSSYHHQHASYQYHRNAPSICRRRHWTLSSQQSQQESDYRRSTEQQQQVFFIYSQQQETQERHATRWKLFQKENGDSSTQEQVQQQRHQGDFN